VNLTEKPPCFFCGGPAKRCTLLRPKLRGGRKQDTNRVPACRRCTMAKGIATLEEFREMVRRMLIGKGRHNEGFHLKFPGEGAPPIAWPKLDGHAGRPRKPAEAGLTCACGRWIVASKLAGHLSVCRV
jgi:hypothetical protein